MITSNTGTTWTPNRQLLVRHDHPHTHVRLCDDHPHGYTHRCADQHAHEHAHYEDAPDFHGHAPPERQQ